MSIDKKPAHQSICVGTTQPDLCDNGTSMSVVLSRDNEMVTDVSFYSFCKSYYHLIKKLIKL